MKKVAVIMGSDSDLPVVEKARATLAAYGVPTVTHIMSARRTPAETAAFAARAREDGFGVIIAAAGKAAHLAGALAAGTTLPVIGIPMKLLRPRRVGRAFVHRSDAVGHPRGNGGH